MTARRIVNALAVLAVAGLATNALASRDDRPGARTAATQQCFQFTVVQPDPLAGFPAGVYNRQNFSPGNSLSCNTTFDLFRSYLYDPQTLRGWTVGPLTGSLRGLLGKRFVMNRTGGRVGFNVYRGSRPPVNRLVTQNVPLVANTTQIYAISIPTRTPEVAQSAQLVNGAGAVLLATGFKIMGRNTLYYATVRSPQVPLAGAAVQFKYVVQA
jgi:hypothetical protein